MVVDLVVVVVDFVVVVIDEVVFDVVEEEAVVLLELDAGRS